MNATNNSNPNWDDALIDRGLAEILGNETPPDLTEKILAAEANPTARVTLAEPRRVPVSRTHHWVMFASAACALIAMGTFAFMKPSQHLLSGRDKATNNLEQIGMALAQTERATVELPEFQVTKPTSTISVPDGGTVLLGGLKRSSEQSGEQIMLGVTSRIIIQEGEEERLGIATEEQGEGDGKMNLNAFGTRFAPTIKNQAAYEPSDLSSPSRQSSFATDGPAPLAEAPALAEAPSAEHEFRFKGDEAEAFVPQQNMGIEGKINDAYATSPQSQNSAPAAEVPPVVYPDAEAWDITNSRRKKYSSVELGAPVQAELSLDSDGVLGDIVTDERNFDWRRESNTWEDVRRSELRIFGLTAKEQSRGVRFRIDAVPGQNLGRRAKEQNAGWGLNADNSGDQYTPIEENDFITAKGGDAVSTFSIDVDTASYANVRQFLEQSAQLPPPDAVRIEELVNYFPYDYQEPTDDTPFAANMEVAECPWNREHRLARIAIKGKEMDRKTRPQSNLVFLIDVSGSMDEPSKLPLLVEGMKAFTRELGENDKVAIVVYASSEGMALPSTRGDQQQMILTALDNLRAGGSTAGGAGIELAYKTATDNFIKGGTNRVILCTDGDFNVGVTSTGDLTRLAEQKAKDTKVFLTVLGFGRGNLNDSMMESISGKGNGNYHYVDNLTEARKVLVEEMAGTLVTIAKDVKIQVEFNPAEVAGYRLIGYENRMLATQDFNDDKKDAGEIGAGHTVTALYEIVPAGKNVGTPSVDPLKYQSNGPSPQSAGEAKNNQSSGEGSSEPSEDQGFEIKGGRGGFEMGNGFGGRPLAGLATDTAKPRAASNELLTLKLRYKLPEADISTKVEYPITDKEGSFADASDDFQFAAAVASFGMMLRHSQHQGQTSFDAILEIAQGALGKDPHGYRAEFLDLVRAAKNIAGGQ
jgi:Ca-activated chloride channel family protein